MTSPIDSTNGSSSTDTSSSTTASGSKTDALAQKDTFLKLLVAQIRNQDPLNPGDSIQFVSQLAQFSELEQITEIRSDLADMKAGLAGETSEEA